MAMAVVYTTFAGQIVSENRGGVTREYISDPLGSTIALASDSAITDTWDYWPYGEVMSRTGTNPTPFTFVGTLGYFKDLLDKLFYVRARHYQPNYGRWLTVDPLWPDESAYAYVGNGPANRVDPSGLWNPACIGCGICLGAAIIAALLGCFGAPEGMWECIKNFIRDNPWTWVIIAGCLILCGACLGPPVIRFIRGLIKPKPRLVPGNPKAPPYECYAMCMSLMWINFCKHASDRARCLINANLICSRICGRPPWPIGGGCGGGSPVPVPIAA